MRKLTKPDGYYLYNPYVEVDKFSLDDNTFWIGLLNTDGKTGISLDREDMEILKKEIEDVLSE